MVDVERPSGVEPLGFRLRYVLQGNAASCQDYRPCIPDEISAKIGEVEILAGENRKAITFDIVDDVVLKWPNLFVLTCLRSMDLFTLPRGARF